MAKEKQSPFLFILRRILTLLVIAFKACLLLPIPLFMVWFSYTVDISGLFQGELAPREVANMMLAGKTVSNYDQMDERQVLELYVQNMTEEQVPETLALGSSRVMQLNQALVGGRFFNGGMSGASFMDIANVWYLFERADKIPQNLILCVDPWLFNGASAADLNKNADTELFSEFMEKGLGLVSDYEEPDTLALWKALVDPAYFQGNVRYYLKQRETGNVTTEDGNDIPFKELSGDVSQLDQAIKFSDGSIQYPLSFRSWNHDQVMAEALLQAGTIDALHGFDTMDPYWTDLFDQFIQHVQSKGVHVTFLLTPYHPFICRHVHNNPEGLEGFFQVEPWLREYASAHNIPVYGSYHAGRAGIPESLFFDGLHCRGEALRLIFPGVENARLGLPSLYSQRYAEQYPDYSGLLIGTDSDVPQPDAEWFNQTVTENEQALTAQAA